VTCQLHAMTPGLVGQTISRQEATHGMRLARPMPRVRRPMHDFGVQCGQASLGVLDAAAPPSVRLEGASHRIVTRPLPVLRNA
jgi:hypothetical protein